MDDEQLAVTRLALHAIAELVVAGPQHRAHGTIRLQVTPGGFGGVASSVRVEGAELVWDGGRTPLSGTCRSLAEAAGLDVGAPTGVYHDGSGLGPDDPIVVEENEAGLVAEWFARGDSALRTFAPDLDPVLWPEHFDLAITLDEVNYGVSPGDATVPGPYAYVGPWTPREGEFWNVPFGAIVPAELAPDHKVLAAFFAEGRRQAARS